MRTLLTGLSEWQWLGAFIARMAVGLLFFLSGRGKLFVPERREQMRESLVAAGIPFASINAIFAFLLASIVNLLELKFPQQTATGTHWRKYAGCLLRQNGGRVNST